MNHTRVASVYCPHGVQRCKQEDEGLLPPRSPAPRTEHPSITLPSLGPAHLFVSYFYNECFGVGQAARPQAQAHAPQGLPAEYQPRDPGQHPDSGVIADGPPWTATVAAEPLWMGATGPMKQGAGEGRTEQDTGRRLEYPLLHHRYLPRMKLRS